MTEHDPDAAFDPAVFKHTPELKGRIIPPEASNVRLSYERFAEFDRIAAEENWPPDWRMDHDEREANRRALLQGRLDKPLWIFAYGSLIWDPGTHLDQIRRAHLPGWHRSFCMQIEGGRGTPENPALMLALDNGGACEGVVFRIAADLVDRETEILWMREMFSGSYCPMILPVDTPQGPVEAVSFVIDRTNRRYVPGLDIDETARIVARAEGRLGRNFDYLDQLVDHLRELGMEDRAMTELHAMACSLRNG